LGSRLGELDERSASGAALSAVAATLVHLAETERRPTSCVSAKTEIINLALASGGLPPPHLRLLKRAMLEIAAAHAGVTLRTA
jgi:hypothetical protein